MNLLQSEHVRAGDFNTYNPRGSSKTYQVISRLISDYKMTDRKIHNRLQNSSIGEILEGVCRNDNKTYGLSHSFLMVSLCCFFGWSLPYKGWLLLRFMVLMWLSLVGPRPIRVGS